MALDFSASIHTNEERTVSAQQKSPFRSWMFIYAAFFLVAGDKAMALEEPEYEVLLQSRGIEFRRYDPYLVAEVTVTGDSADRQAFRILAGYIFGKNHANEKMSMTAPVETRDMDYAFVMESRYAMDSLPKPDDERIRLREKPPRIVAVHEFSGGWSRRNIARNEQRLMDGLSALGVDVLGDVELARYNSPFTPWFLRRNEVIVPVDWTPATASSLIAAEAPARL